MGILTGEDRSEGALMEEYLKTMLPFWEQLTSGQREMAVRSLMVSCFQKGEFIFNPLKKTEGLRLILEGSFRVAIAASRGKELTLERMRRGDICVVSLLALMNLLELDLYAEAEEPSRILVIPGAVYRQLHEENQTVRDFDHRLVIASLGQMVEIVSHVALASADEKTADLLLRSSSQMGTDILALTHEEIARDIGTAREVVSRILKQFQQDGMVRQGRGKIQILDKAALEAQKNG